MPDSVENLEVWQEGVAVVEALYGLTESWPQSEMYGLTSQARRAAVSIPANLAEGVGRGTSKEAARFAQIALGSPYELDTLLILSGRLGYTEVSHTAELRRKLSILARRISRYIAYLAKLEAS